MGLTLSAGALRERGIWYYPCAGSKGFGELRVCCACFGPLPVTILLFDFDGTLADTLPTVIAISNRLAPQYGYAPTTSAEVEQLRNTSSRDILRSSRVARWHVPCLLWRLSRELRSELASIGWIPGIQPALIQLQQDHHLLGIVTSNSARNVQQFLGDRQGDQYFSVVKAGVSILGKQRVLKRLLWKHNWNPSQVLYIGDEVRDIEAARAAGVRSGAVTWGFNTQAVLYAAQPDFLLEEPQQLLGVARSLKAV